MALEHVRYTFQREPRSTMIAEARRLFRLHWDEVARNKELFPLEPDDAFYEGMEKQGKLRVYTIRDVLTGELTGYAVFFVAPHPHYRMALWAVSDIFWTKPKVRATKGFLSRLFRRLRYILKPSLIRTSTGIRFFDFIENQLKAEGVNVMHTTYKVAHPAPGRVLRYLGHVHTENGYSKVLNVTRRG